MKKWIAVDEVGNDNFATSIYENDYKGLLIARCNQNGQYPWQAAAIIRGLERNKSVPNADGINLILSEADVPNSAYLAVKIANAIERGVYT